MSTVLVDSNVEAKPYFDDGGLSTESAHRISDLFDRIGLEQEQLGITPIEPTTGLIAIDGFVQDALYKEGVLDAEAQLECDLRIAESELERLESWRRRDRELGVDRIVAEEQSHDLRAWRNRNDPDAFRRFSVRAENASNDIRRMDEARSKVTSLKATVASHRRQHSVIYGTEE